MLTLTVHTRHTGDVQLEFEHSLLSLSKWEEKTGKVFLSKIQKTTNEWLLYFQLMLTSPEQDPDLVIALRPQQQDDLRAYVDSTPGATSAPPRTGDGKPSEPLSSEIIYAQMVLQKISKDYETWHVNRLLTMLAWVAYKQTPPKDRKDTRSVREKLTDWAHINQQNRERFNSNG